MQGKPNPPKIDFAIAAVLSHLYNKSVDASFIYSLNLKQTREWANSYVGPRVIIVTDLRIWGGLCFCHFLWQQKLLPSLQQGE